MNLSKNAIGNLINRYKAVLKKCHLLNTFGSLALAGMLAMGAVNVANAEPVPPYVEFDDGITNIIVGDRFELAPDGFVVSDGQAIITADGITGNATLTLNATRDISLGQVHIGVISGDSAGPFSVTASRAETSLAHSFFSGELFITAGNTSAAHTTYTIEAGLTHIVDGFLALKGSAQGAAATQVVKGNLYVIGDGNFPHIWVGGPNGFLEIYNGAQVAAKENFATYTDLYIGGVTVDLKDDGAALGLADNTDLTYRLEYSTVKVDDGNTESKITGHIYGDVLAQDLRLDIGQGDSLSISGDYIVKRSEISRSTPAPYASDVPAIDGAVHIGGNYSSDGHVHYSGDGSINVAGTAKFNAGAADRFFVEFNAGATTVTAGDNASTVVYVYDGGTIASLAVQADAYSAAFYVEGGEFTIDGDVTLESADNGNAAFLVRGNGDEATTLNIAGDIKGSGVFAVLGGDALGHVNIAGGDVVVNLEGALESGVVADIIGGRGGDAGNMNRNAGAAVAGGDARITGASGGSFTLTGGEGGSGTASVDGGAGGDARLIAAQDAEYGTITLGGQQQLESLVPLGIEVDGQKGTAAYDTYNVSNTADVINMVVDESNELNVIAGDDPNTADVTEAAAPASLTVKELNAQVGEITIAGADSINTAILKVSGENAAYKDSMDLRVHVGAHGTLDLSGVTLNAGGAKDALAGSYNLEGGTVVVQNLTIAPHNLISNDTAAAGNGQIDFGADSDSLLKVSDTLTIIASSTINNAVNIETKSLDGQDASSGRTSSIVATVRLGSEDAKADSKLTFTGGGAINAELVVAGGENGGGIVYITAEEDATAENATTTVREDIIINHGGELNVQSGAILTLADGADLSSTASGILNVGGTLNAVNTTSSNTDLRFGTVQINLLDGGTLGTSGHEVILSAGTSLDVASGTTGNIAGTLVGENVSNYNVLIDGTLNVQGDYKSESGNTYLGDGTIKVSGAMNFSGDAYDQFYVALDANIVNVDARGEHDYYSLVELNAGSKITSLNVYGGDVSAENGGNAVFVAQSGVVEPEVVDPEVDDSEVVDSEVVEPEVVETGVFEIGDINLKNGEGAGIYNGFVEGMAIVRVLGGEGIQIYPGKSTELRVTGSIKGDGSLIIQGGTGAEAGSLEEQSGAVGGDISLSLAPSTTIESTVTVSYVGGTGGLGGGHIAALGGRGGNVQLIGINGNDYALIGGTGGEGGVAGAGGAGGDAILNAVNEHSYGSISLRGGKDGEDAVEPEAGVGGAGGKAFFNVEGGVEATVETLTVTEGGVVQVGNLKRTVGGTAELVVRENYSNTGVAMIADDGSLDLAAVSANKNYALDSIHNVSGENAQLVLKNLMVDAGSLASTDDMSTLMGDAINIHAGGQLLVTDTLTLSGGDSGGSNGVVNADTNIKTQSLAYSTTGIPEPVSLTREATFTGVTFNDGTLTFSGDAKSTADATVSNINTNLIIAGDSRMIVGYTTGSDGAVSMGSTTLAAGNTLDIKKSYGLNVLHGATLDVSEGKLSVVANGFVDYAGDFGRTSLPPLMLGEDGVGTLIVNGADLGFTDTIDAYDASKRSVKDAFSGTLVVEGLTGEISYADLVSLYVDNTEDPSQNLVTGIYGNLDFKGVEVIMGGTFLSDLVPTIDVDTSVEIGTGIVDGTKQGGLVSIVSVIGDIVGTDIVIDNVETALQLTGSDEVTELFSNANGGKILVKKGQLALGSYENDYDLTLSADIVMDGRENDGYLTVLDDVDMRNNVISSVLIEEGAEFSNNLMIIQGQASLNVKALDLRGAFSNIALVADSGDSSLTVNSTSYLEGWVALEALSDGGKATLNLKGGEYHIADGIRFYKDEDVATDAITMNVLGDDGYSGRAQGADTQVNVFVDLKTDQGIVNISGGNTDGNVSGKAATLNLYGGGLLGEVNVSGGNERPVLESEGGDTPMPIGSTSAGNATLSVNGVEATAEKITLANNNATATLRVTDSTRIKELGSTATEYGYADAGLHVQTLDATAGGRIVVTAYSGFVRIDEATPSPKVTLKVDTYKESAATQVEISGVGAMMDLSSTSFSNAGGAGDVDFQGSYNLTYGGILKLNNLTLASTDLVSGSASAGQIGFEGFGALQTNTLTFSDTSAITLNQSGMNLITSTLNSTQAVTLSEANINFSGGGSINTDLSTTGGSYSRITVGSMSELEGADEPLTTLAASKTLNIQNNKGLLIYDGHHLNASAGTLKVVAGGFDADGFGTLTAKNEDFGTFGFSNQEAEATFDRSDANVQDLYYGDLVITGLTGRMSKAEYDSFLINAANAMIEGNNATLYFDGVSVMLDPDATLEDLNAGSNFKDQSVKTGTPTGGGDSVDVDNGGKVVVGSIEQSDPDKPVDLKVAAGTILGLTGEGVDGNGDTTYGNEVFKGDITGDGGVELGSADSEKKSTLAGSVDVKGSAKFTNVQVEGDIKQGTADAPSSEAAELNNVTADNVELNNSAGTTMSGDNELKDVKISGAQNVTQDGGSFKADSFTSDGAAGFEAINGAKIDFTEVAMGGAQMNLGSATDNLPTKVSAQKARHDFGWVILDPVFSDGKIVSATSYAIGEFTGGKVDAQFVVGQNSFLVLGDASTAWAEQAFNNSGLQWKKAGETTGIGAALFIRKSQTLHEQSLIYVSGSATANATTGLPEINGIKLNVDENDAIFEGDSLLVIDASDNGVGVDTANGHSKVALTAAPSTNYKAGLNVYQGAKLHIVDGKAGTIVIAKDFNVSGTDVSVGGWGYTGTTVTDPSDIEDNLTFSSSALDGYVNIDDDGDVILTIVGGIDSVAGYTQFQGETVSYLNNMLVGGVQTESIYAGRTFLSRAITEDKFNMGKVDEKRTTATIEGAAQVGAAGNAAAGTMAAGLAAGNAVGGRNTGLTSKVESGNTGSVTLNNGEITAETGTNGGNMTEKSGLGVWLTPLYKWSTGSGFESGGLEHGYDMGLGGIALGVDFTNKIAADSALRFGLSFNVGAGYADSTGDYNETNNDFNFWGLTAYGAFQKENFVATLDIGFTSTYNEITQDLPASMLMGDLNADVDSLAFSVGLNLEYTFNAGMMDITPHAGVRFMSVTTDEYDIESSYGLVATVEEDTQNVWYFPVGVTFSADIESNNGWTFTPKLDLGFIAAAGDLEATSKTRFTGVPGTLELAMQNVDGFAFNGGLGFELSNPDNGVSIGLNYNLQAGEKETGHMIFANFRYDF